MKTLVPEIKRTLTFQAKSSWGSSNYWTAQSPAGKAGWLSRQKVVSKLPLFKHDEDKS